ncbi:hypothetical protein KBI31_00280 [Patescibacteria group bacterium]|nr:hypothetical protein [Patescibacteria group bacterium]
MKKRKINIIPYLIICYIFFFSEIQPLLADNCRRLIYGDRIDLLNSYAESDALGVVPSYQWTSCTSPTNNTQNNSLTGTILETATTPVVPTNSLKFTAQVGLPNFPKTYIFSSNSTIPIAQLVQGLFTYGVQIITVLSLLVVIIGGFLWSMAGGNGQKVGEAKQWIFSGLGGLALTLFSYLILRTINVNLVTFNPAQIKIIGGLDLITSRKSDPNQYFPDAAQKTMTIAESTDPNGKKACCLINNVGAAEGPRQKWNVRTIRCATLQAPSYTGSNSSTDKLCINFFNSTNMESSTYIIANIYRTYDINDFVYSEGSVPDKSAVLLTGGFCEENPSLKTLCMGKNHPSYCQTRSKGSECITSDNYWGYCNKEKKCVRCSNYGGVAPAWYACPDYRGKVVIQGHKLIGDGGYKNNSNNPDDPLGYKCGTAMYGCAQEGKNKEYRCTCYAHFCYDECIKNGGTKNKHCKDVKPKDYELYKIDNRYYENTCEKLR